LHLAPSRPDRAEVRSNASVYNEAAPYPSFLLPKLALFLEFFQNGI
jgi:hypothetical protein